jgi:hypothetical protein
VTVVDPAPSARIRAGVSNVIIAIVLSAEVRVAPVRGWPQPSVTVIAPLIPEKSVMLLGVIAIDAPALLQTILKGTGLLVAFATVTRTGPDGASGGTTAVI